MNSSLNRDGTGAHTRITVLIVGIIAIVVILAGSSYARGGFYKPYVEPGDGDGPAGVSESISKDLPNNIVIPIYSPTSEQRQTASDIKIITLNELIRIQFVMIVGNSK